MIVDLLESDTDSQYHPPDIYEKTIIPDISKLVS